MAAIVISAQEHNIELLSLIVGVGYLFNPKVSSGVSVSLSLKERLDS